MWKDVGRKSDDVVIEAAVVNKPVFVVVDDDASLLDVLKSTLEFQGHGCEVFSSAESALEHLTEKPCDILITDIVMQGMKGLQFAKTVKQMRPETNIIVMTGFIDDYSYDQAIDAGASDFIKKPFTVHEMMVRIKHVLLQEKLREMSNTDELTGLLNRRGFFAIAHQQMKVANRNRSALVLLFADMDGFKAINDQWGHHVGDEALVAMAGIFRQTFRDSDVIARISGDEFALLLLDTPESNLSIVASRLQKKIDAFNAGSDGNYSLAVSTGMAVYDHDRPCGIDELLKQADKKMYEQKQLKKNTA
jgi:two-component system cell cycle response regulator